MCYLPNKLKSWTDKRYESYDREKRGMPYTLITTITHPFDEKPEWNWIAMHTEMHNVIQLIMTSLVFSFLWLQGYRRPPYAKAERMEILQISEIYLL